MHITPKGRADGSRVGRPGRVLVVGCGFLGSHVAAGFLQRGVPTTVLTRRDPEPDAERLIAGATRIRGDAGDRDAVARALEGIDHVVWAAGGLLPAESDLRKIDDVTAALPPLLTVLEQIAGRDGVSLSFLSSGGTVYGTPTVLPVPELHHLQPITAHGVTKAASELYLALFREVHGVRTIALRCGNVYGPGQRPNRSQGIVATALACAASGMPLPLFGDGAAVRDYVFVDDVVDVVCRLAPREDVPEVVNVGTGEGTNVVELLDVIGRVTGRHLAVERHPARPGDVRSIVLDTTLLQTLIAYEPISFEVGVAATWEAVPRVARLAAR